MADEKKEDVLLLHSPTDDGEGVRVVRARDERIETGELRRTEEGKPIQGEIVKLHPREGTPRVCDVETLYRPEEAEATKGRPGPAQVASRSYRANWDRIFQTRRTPPGPPS